MIPFTADQFLSVFENYNNAVWPAQPILSVLALAAVYLAFKPRILSSKSAAAIIAAFWIWMGLVYHFWFFTSINRAALIFALFFVIQGILFLTAGVWKDLLRFQFRPDCFGFTGGTFLLFALLIYPVLGYWFGHRYPASPTFGLPCPTTIFTFGLLLWTDRRVPLYLLPIPLAWSFIGISAAISLEITEDFALLATGVIGSVLITLRHTSTGTLSERPSDR